jgi:intein/homing endonuclease
MGKGERGSVYRELLETVEGGLQKWSISLYRSSVRKRGLTGKPGRGLICWGLMCRRRF